MSRPCPFDVREVPFSTTGSWISLSPVTDLHTTADFAQLAQDYAGWARVMAGMGSADKAQRARVLAAMNDTARWLDKNVGRAEDLLAEVAGQADPAGRDAYLPHPAHQAFVARLSPLLADVLVID